MACRVAACVLSPFRSWQAEFALVELAAPGRSIWIEFRLSHHHCWSLSRSLHRWLSPLRHMVSFVWFALVVLLFVLHLSHIHSPTLLIHRLSIYIRFISFSALTSVNKNDCLFFLVQLCACPSFGHGLRARSWQPAMLLKAEPQCVNRMQERQEAYSSCQAKSSHLSSLWVWNLSACQLRCFSGSVPAKCWQKCPVSSRFSWLVSTDVLKHKRNCRGGRFELYFQWLIVVSTLQMCSLDKQIKHPSAL